MRFDIYRPDDIKLLLIHNFYQISAMQIMHYYKETAEKETNTKQNTNTKIKLAFQLEFHIIYHSLSSFHIDVVVVPRLKHMCQVLGKSNTCRQELILS